jgi:tetratricopeptide (TPR) repeat protein
MKVRATVRLFGLLALGVVAACSRNDIEAINLAAEGDQIKKMDIDGAASKYDQATKLDPTNPLLFEKLGDAYERKGAWDKLAATMATATRLNPKNAKYWYKRGRALEEQAIKGPLGWDESKEPLEKCIAIDPNYADCYYLLGEVMLHLDDEQRALENWTKAVQHDPNELTFYVPLAQLYISLGYYDQASAVLKEGLSRAAKPDTTGIVGLHQLTAVVAQAKGDLPGTAAALEKARAADTEGKSPEILFNLGSTYAVMTPPKKQEAAQMLKGFQTKACRGTKALMYKAQCDQAQSLLVTVGGGAQ